MQRFSHVLLGKLPFYLYTKLFMRSPGLENHFDNVVETVFNSFVFNSPLLPVFHAKTLVLFSNSSENKARPGLGRPLTSEARSATFVFSSGRYGLVLKSRG